MTRFSGNPDFLRRVSKRKRKNTQFCNNFCNFSKFYCFLLNLIFFLNKSNANVWIPKFRYDRVLLVIPEIYIFCDCYRNLFPSCAIIVGILQHGTVICEPPNFIATWFYEWRGFVSDTRNINLIFHFNLAS